ncbi:MAG TPA: class I SAM-dependent methyltransferase [Gemmatimonadaceae bacterium]
MPLAIDAVRDLNAAARGAGVAEWILQFDNVATHAQYALPYAITARHVRPGDAVLDWGCGNGHFSLFLESLGARVTGYSFEPPPRAMARSRTFNFVGGSPAEPRALPFPNASFDAVTGVGVLEHVWETGGDERASLAELARVLKPGGVLLTFHLPNRAGWVERVVHLLRLNKHFHRRKFEAAEIQRLWSDAGFGVVELGLYNALPRTELRRLPGAVRHSVAFARAFEAVDNAMISLAPRICTNFYVVGVLGTGPK